MPRQEADPTKTSSGPALPKQGFSQFVSRVLDQLSLSAWLPAAMLVGSFAVLLQLHSQSDRDLAFAVNSLLDKPFGLVVLALFALILATMVTQAFEFEVIRLLEGYWGNGRILRPLAWAFISHQRRVFDRNVRERDKLTLKAFRSARLLEREIVRPENRYIVDLIDEDLDGRPSSAGKGWCARRRAREAAQFEWRPYASAQVMRRLDVVEAIIGEYPDLHRLLPTRLGNILRTAEDAKLGTSHSELEGAVIRRWDALSSSLQQEHDQYRTRLDMYCSLVFVFALLGTLSPLLLTRGQQYAWWTLATSVGYLAMSIVSYSAAIASARGYGVILRVIADVAPESDQLAVSRSRWRRKAQA